MPIHLDYRDARPIYQQIKDALRLQILSGVLREGERLPSVRELAAESALNPNTIQRAYRELEAEGCICSIPGKGSFVCSAHQVGQARKAELLADFDKTARELLRLGLDLQALARRLEALSPAENDPQNTEKEASYHD